MELKNVTEDNMSVLYELIITVPNSATITFILFRRKFKIHGEYRLPQGGGGGAKKNETQKCEMME